MPSDQVVCLTCYRLTNRLEPGLYPCPHGTTPTPEGYAIKLTRDHIAIWDKARMDRIGA